MSKFPGKFSPVPEDLEARRIFNRVAAILRESPGWEHVLVLIDQREPGSAGYGNGVTGGSLTVRDTSAILAEVVDGLRAGQADGEEKGGP